MLGRCLLRLQQYERLMKGIVASHCLSVSASSPNGSLEAQVAATSGKTLGQLVGRMFGTYVLRDGDDYLDPQPAKSDHGNSFTFRVTRSLPPESYEATQRRFSELVELRNLLVHHFLEQHDLWTVHGCDEAVAALVAAYEQIDLGANELRDWAEEMEKTRQSSAALLSDPVVLELIVNGVGPDGTVHWPTAGVVYALRRACRNLAVDGWTRVDKAASWITEHEPAQTPKKYGCTRWRQVIHEARQFEIRYLPERGHPGAWYREL
ncbi:OST-HTH/LOTUS domain-containing protein [Lysobacter sp. H21R4]|nr:OST-HTH/LOTUS domain-containing protein [Lysobacter sp. H21R4]